MDNFRTYGILLIATLAICMQCISQASSLSEVVGPSTETRRTNGDAMDRARLRRKLFKYYDPQNIPDDVKVKLGLMVFDFDIDESKDLVDTQAWFEMHWNDNRLRWNNETTGVNNLRVGAQEVWKPDIVMYNQIIRDGMVSCKETNPIARSNGEVIWVPPCHFKSYCKKPTTENGSSIYECDFVFGSWTYDKEMIDIVATDETPKMEFYIGKTWNIISQNVERVEKEYKCCPGEVYVSFNYNFKLERANNVE